MDVEKVAEKVWSWIEDEAANQYGFDSSTFRLTRAEIVSGIAGLLRVESGITIKINALSANECIERSHEIATMLESAIRSGHPVKDALTSRV